MESLNLKASIALPKGQFAAAAVMTKVHAVVKQAEAAMTKALGVPFAFTAKTVKVREAKEEPAN